MNIQTRQQHGQAIDRLSRANPDALSIFIASLALHDGPVGEQVCTFIVGDDLAEASIQIEGRINSLRRHEAKSRHKFGREVGQRLMFILDAIEALVLAKDLQCADRASCQDQGICEEPEIESKTRNAAGEGRGNFGGIEKRQYTIMAPDGSQHSISCGPPYPQTSGYVR